MKNTRRFYFEALSALAAENAELFPAGFDEFVVKELEALDKKKAKVADAHTAEDAEFIAALESADKALTAMEIIRTSEFFAEASTQKVASVAKRLVDAGAVVKTKTDKGTAYALAENAEVSAE
jgi:LytS/YehU family sensor histidine kinase